MIWTIQCEEQSNTGMCVAIAKCVGDVLDSSHYCWVLHKFVTPKNRVYIHAKAHNNQTYSRRLSAAVLRFFSSKICLRPAPFLLLAVDFFARLSYYRVWP